MAGETPPPPVAVCAPQGAQTEAPPPPVVAISSEQIAREQAAAADTVAEAARNAAEKQRIAAATAMEPSTAEEVTKLLKLVAGEIQVSTAQEHQQAAASQIGAAESPEEAQKAKNKETRAKKVLTEAAKELKSQEDAFEKMKKNPDAPVADRLFVYDMDIAQLTMKISDIDGYAQTIIGELADPAKSEAAQAKMVQIGTMRTDLQSKIAHIREERDTIGEPAERAPNYVARAVTTLMTGMGEVTEEQMGQIMDNPLGYLKQQIDNPEVGMTGLLAKSGIKPAAQKKLLTIASAESAQRTVKRQETLQSVQERGTQGLLAFFLLLYAAFMANRKAKGQQ